MVGTFRSFHPVSPGKESSRPGIKPPCWRDCGSPIHPGAEFSSHAWVSGRLDLPRLGRVSGRHDCCADLRRYLKSLIPRVTVLVRRIVQLSSFGPRIDRCSMSSGNLPTPAHTRMQEQTHPEECIASAVENEGETERNLPDAERNQDGWPWWLAS